MHHPLPSSLFLPHMVVVLILQIELFAYVQFNDVSMMYLVWILNIITLLPATLLTYSIKTHGIVSNTVKFILCVARQPFLTNKSL